MVVYRIIMGLLILCFLLVMLFDSKIDVTDDGKFILHYTWNKKRYYKILFKI
jgi:hypothetical protein